MVAAVYYFATDLDQVALLDFIGEPTSASLHPWPVVEEPVVLLARVAALQAAQVMIVRSDLGPPEIIRPGDDAMDERSKAGVFNRLNWNLLRPTAKEGLVDSNRSPVLLWTPGTAGPSEVTVSTMGSQAGSMRAISVEYERWANRIMNWVRRRGTKVWGVNKRGSDPISTSTYRSSTPSWPCPRRLHYFERGGRGRDSRR